MQDASEYIGAGDKTAAATIKAVPPITHATNPTSVKGKDKLAAAMPRTAIAASATAMIFCIVEAGRSKI